MSNNTMNNNKHIKEFAVGGTLFVWLVAFAVSYESQIQFAEAMGLTGKILGVSQSFVFPLLTDLVIMICGAWSLNSVINGESARPYRLLMWTLGFATTWFNLNHVDMADASYTKMVAHAWAALLVIATSEMILHAFMQEAERARNFISPADKSEERIIMAFELLAQRLSPPTAAPQIGADTPAISQELAEIETPQLPTLDPAKGLEAAKAKKQLRVNETLQKMAENPNISKAQLAKEVGVTPNTLNSYISELEQSGRVVANGVNGQGNKWIIGGKHAH